MAVHPGAVARLVRAVAVLSLPAAAQAEYLTKTGVAPLADELALELHDSLELLSQLISHGWISAKAADPLYRLDEKLADMSGMDRKHLWLEPALESADEWRVVRIIAKEALFDVA